MADINVFRNHFKKHCKAVYDELELSLAKDYFDTCDNEQDKLTRDKEVEELIVNRRALRLTADIIETVINQYEENLDARTSNESRRARRRRN